MRNAGDPRSLARQAAWLSAVLAALTVAVIVVPGLRLAVDAPGLRIALETAGVAALASAALLLALLARDGNAPRRQAFVAALIVQAGVNTAFGVVPNLLGVPDTTLASTFYPWLAARYVAGLLFVLAAVPRSRSRASAGTVVLAALAVIAVIELAVAAAGDSLPVPPPLSRPPVIDLDAGHVLVELVPLVLFGLGALLAGRSYGRSGAPLERWLALALLTGVFTQVHEALFPAALGRVVTSADVLRAGSTTLLAAGAVGQVRRLVADRGRALSLLQADLGRSQDLVAALHAAADREEAFRSIVAHELASPVAAIGAYAHLLESTDGPRGPEIRAVQAVRGEAERLGALVRRLDELRQLDDPGFVVELRPVAVRPLLDEAAGFARGLPGGHPVVVDADEARVLADPIRLGQVLRNLLSNAVRYAPDGSPVSVLGRRCERDAYSVTVVDRGPGIGNDDPELLFAAYERGAAVAGAPGTGLGLHVARRIVDAHGGEIGFVDPALPGARVRVTLGLAT